MSKRTVMIIGFISTIILVCIGFSYNKIFKSESEVNSQYIALEPNLNKYYDLVSKLVNSVSDTMTYEKKIINSIEDTEAKLKKEDSIDRKVKLNNQLERSMVRILASVDNYPELELNEEIGSTLAEISDTATIILDQKEKYNKKAKKYYNEITKFPINIVAKLFGFNVKTYFDLN